MAGLYPSASDLGVAPTAVMSTSAPYDATAYAQQQQTPPSQGHTPQDAQPPPGSSTQQQQQQQQASTSLLPSSQPRSVKRPRPVKSCTECRKRKLKCDRLCPCSQCRKSSRVCRYAPENDSNNLSDASDTEGNETRPIKRMAIGPSTGTTVDGGMYVPARSVGEGVTTFSMLEELAGRTERIERMMMSRETGRGGRREEGGSGIEISPETVRGLSIKHGGSRTRFYGPASPRVLLNLVR